MKPDENLQVCFTKSHLFTPLDYLDTITVLLLDKVVAFPAHKMLSIETLKVRYRPGAHRRASPRSTFRRVSSSCAWCHSTRS